MTLSNLLASFEKLWPKESAEDWDRPGQTVRNPSQEINEVLLAVDVSAEVID